jgi:hypothetical protein
MVRRHRRRRLAKDLRHTVEQKIDVEKRLRRWLVVYRPRVRLGRFLGVLWNLVPGGNELKVKFQLVFVCSLGETSHDQLSTEFVGVMASSPTLLGGSRAILLVGPTQVGVGG